MFAIVIVVVFVLTQFIIINAKIPSGSMENTIMTHDRLIGFRFAYWFEEPQRGDIILFEYPVDETQIYIKRVIGLPGETVEIRDGRDCIAKHLFHHRNDGSQFLLLALEALILRFLNRYALGAMLMLEMTNPKKERRDSGISSGVS